MDTMTQEPDIDNMSEAELEAFLASEEEKEQAQASGEEDLDPEILDAMNDHEQPAAEPEAQVADENPQVPDANPPIPAGASPAILQAIVDIQAEIARLRQAPKNHVEGKPAAGKVYKRVGEFAGKAPQQQRDLAAILTNRIPLNGSASEEEVFKFVVEDGQNYHSIANSKQHPTYLFKYYRGLRDTGFVARGFLTAN